jgi:hypothetical protein
MGQMIKRLVAHLALIVGSGLTLVAVVLQGGPTETEPALLLSAVVSLVVGHLILVRADGHRVGWALMLIAVCLAGTAIAGGAADRGSFVADVIGGTTWFMLFVALGLLIYWYPTGRAVSPGWRWVGWLGGVAGLLALSYMLTEEICIEGGGEACLVFAPNPIGIPGIPNSEYELWGIGFLLGLGFGAASVVTLVVRFFKARGVERLQLKWFVMACLVLVLGFFLSELDFMPEWFTYYSFGFLLLALPVAVGASILRYRLYEIDRIISRTVSYALVVGLLGLVLFGLVAGLGAWLGRENQLVVAVSTLAVAGLFNPVRRRVQGWVDRRFNRSRYDAERVMSEFVAGLRGRVDRDGVVEGWVGVVSETMQPTSVGVWVR